MDETVDSFLKEINEIAPPKNIWKECYDENSGFTYYWNTQTDDVTWDVPEGYNKLTDQNTRTHSKKQLYIPPPSEEKLMLGSLPLVNKDNVKIYKIDEGNKASFTFTRNNKNRNFINKVKYRKKSTSDSEEEKIILISSYGSGSSSDDDPKMQKISEPQINQTMNSKIPRSQEESCPAVVTAKTALDKRTSPCDSEDETDLLTQIQTKAKVLKQLGGEVPESVSRLVNDARGGDSKKRASGFSLVAGYGDDSDEESEQEEPAGVNKLFPIVCGEGRGETASTLFPAAKAMDVSQFGAPSAPEERSASSPEPAAAITAAAAESTVDVKAFQRKRRISVSLVNVQKRQPPPPERENKMTSGETSERPGFGFTPATGKEYHGFKSAGVMFPTTTNAVAVAASASSAEEIARASGENGATDFGDERLLKDIRESRGTLDEKLRFLCEGHAAASPVQIMIIQMETLYTAMEQKCLKPVYLKDWLGNTCEDLSKLELEAAPSGWLLQWDRTHKRYYYHNETSGENQWQYPQPDIVSVDEAMDISTTPPPPPASDDEDVENPVESMNLILPPPPPKITEKSVSPPPPPVISDYNLKENLNNGEPFPPGVDETDDTDTVHKMKEPIAPPGRDSFTSELNSFYSDIATMESVQVTKSEIRTNEPVVAAATAFKDNGQIESIPAKKKKKVKMGQGLAMKKKGVSKLVEKWKNVQKSYN